MQCSATSKQTGQPCKRHATPGRTVCHYHGGKSLVGPANPAWKGGRYSRAVPSSLRAAYETALEDPELLSTRDEMALFAARMSEVLSGLDESPGLFNLLGELRTLREVLASAVQDGTLSKVIATVEKIDTLLDRSAEEERTWRELASLAETRRKLADTERKREEALCNYLTATQAAALVERLVSIVASRVKDRRVLSAIADDLALLLGPGE